MIKKTILIFLILIHFFKVSGQYKGIHVSQLRPLDSLNTLLSKSKKDTVRVHLLLKTGDILLGSTNYEENHQGLSLIKEAFALSEKLKYQRGQIEALFGMGAFEEMVKKDYPAAIAYYLQAVPQFEKLGDNQLTFEKYGQLLNACFYLGDYPKAMETALKGLALAEKINNKKQIAHYYSLLGFIYGNQNNLPKAKENFEKYLKMAEEIGNRDMLAHAYTGMTDVYSQEGNYKLALEYQFKTRDLYMELQKEKQKTDPNYAGYKQALTFTYNNIAGLYQALKDYPQALAYSEKCLELARSVGVNKYELVNFLITNGTLHSEKNDFSNAEASLLEALLIADSISHKENIKSCYLALAQMYSAKKDFKKAYDFHTKYSAIKDTLLNEKSSRQLAEMNTRFETQKKDQELTRKDAEIKEQTLQAKQQSTLRNAFIIGFVLVLLLALFIFRGYRHKQKANVEISKQKEIIEDKNKEITDSIQYAKRIQKALLAGDTLLKNNLPDHFVLYKPKDIVSGDFYWAHLAENSFLLCVADCTGHGVPGAFMSLLNISFLNENAAEKNITQPDIILNSVRTAIINALNTEGNEESKDGMDAVLCRFDFKNLKLDYSAANNSFYLIRNNGLMVSEADKMAVGKSPKDTQPFTLHTLQIQKGDLLYIFTDGYADQFGGAKGKKFKYKQLEELLLANHHKPMDEQKKMLDETIETWKNQLEQVDDILILGIKV